MAGIVLFQTASGVPFPVPQTYGEALLIFAVVIAAGAYHRSQEARIKRAEGQVDTVIVTMTEVLTVVRRLEDVRNKAS